MGKKPDPKVTEQRTGQDPKIIEQHTKEKKRSKSGKKKRPGPPRERVNLKDIEELEKICPSLKNERFHTFLILSGEVKFNADMIANGFGLDNGKEIQAIVDKDAGSIAKFVEVRIKKELGSILMSYELTGKKNTPEDLIWAGDIHNSKLEVRCFKFNDKSKVYFYKSSKQNYEGLKEKLKEIDYYELLDVADFPNCRFYSIEKHTVCAWLLLDGDDYLSKKGDMRGDFFKKLLDETISRRGIIKKGNIFTFERDEAQINDVIDETQTNELKSS